MQLVSLGESLCPGLTEGHVRGVRRQADVPQRHDEIYSVCVVTKVLSLATRPTLSRTTAGSCLRRSGLRVSNVRDRVVALDL